MHAVLYVIVQCACALITLFKASLDVSEELGCLQCLISF